MHERFLHRRQVADAVIENRYHVLRVPLVDGMEVPSIRTASRKARAIALNEASMMWCEFLPLTWRTCMVMADAMTNPRQNSSASCGSKPGLPSFAVLPPAYGSTS